MDIRENSFRERVVQPWHILPVVVVESPCLEGFKSCVDMAFGDMG